MVHMLAAAVPRAVVTAVAKCARFATAMKVHGALQNNFSDTQSALQKGMNNRVTTTVSS